MTGKDEKRRWEISLDEMMKVARENMKEENILTGSEKKEKEVETEEETVRLQMITETGIDIREINIKRKVKWINELRGLYFVEDVVLKVVIDLLKKRTDKLHKISLSKQSKDMPEKEFEELQRHAKAIDILAKYLLISLSKLTAYRTFDSNLNTESSVDIMDLPSEAVLRKRIEENLEKELPD